MKRPIVDVEEQAAGGFSALFSAPLPVFLCLLLALMLFCAPPIRQSRAAYPIEDVLLVLPVSEGSQPASLYKLVQRFVRPRAMAPVRLQYLPGRGGSYAWRFLKDKPGNGSVLAALHFPSVMLLAADKDRAFSPDDMAPLAVFAYAANALWVAEDSPVRTLEDLVLQARDSDYGLVVAGAGSYTDHQMAHLIFNRAAGVKTLYLPLISTAESVSAVREKRAAACWGYALVRSSMPGLRPLAVAAPERCPALPDTPTFRERNLEVISGQHFGLAAPAETKEETREAVAAFFLNVFSNKDFLNAILAVGFEPKPLSLRDMPLFVGKQRFAAETFLKAYPMFPQGTRPLPFWFSRNATEQSDAGNPADPPIMLPLSPLETESPAIP